MAKKQSAKKAATAATLTITADCARDAEGFGGLALPILLFDNANRSIKRQQVSTFKAKLFDFGFEALEVLCYADEPRRCEDWDPRNDGDVDVSDEWALVAVLKIADDEQEIVAIFARPAKPTAAWPFPKGKEGESGPEVRSDPYADAPVADVEFTPAMSKSEAHLNRNAGRFELPEPVEVRLKTWTARSETHGDHDVSASSMGFKLKGPNTLIDALLPSLRKTLYAAPEGASEPLPGVQESTPLLRTKGIESMDLKPVFEGWTLRIYHGIDEEEPFVIGGCKVDNFVLVPHDGGSIELDFRVGSSDIDGREAGWLYGQLKQLIEISLHAPVVKAEPIDGTQAAFERDRPPAGKDATDLFTETHGGGEPAGDDDTFAGAHGGDEPGDGSAPDDPDGSGEREAEEQAS